MELHSKLCNKLQQCYTEYDSQVLGESLLREGRLVVSMRRVSVRWLRGAWKVGGVCSEDRGGDEVML